MWERWEHVGSTLSFYNPILRQTHSHTHTWACAHRHTPVKAHFLQHNSNQHTGVQDTCSNSTSWLGTSCQLDFCVYGSGLVFCGVLDAHGCVHSWGVSVLPVCGFINHIVGVSHYKPAQWACGLTCHVASGQCPWYHLCVRPTSNCHGGYYHCSPNPNLLQSAKLATIM